MNIIKTVEIVGSIVFLFTNLSFIYADSDSNQLTDIYQMQFEDLQDTTAKKLFNWIKEHGRFPYMSELLTDGEINGLNYEDIFDDFRITSHTTDLPFDTLTDRLRQLDTNREISKFIEEFIDKEETAKEIFEWIEKNGRFPTITDFHMKLGLDFEEVLNLFHGKYNSLRLYELFRMLEYFNKYNNPRIDDVIDQVEQKEQVVKIISEWIEQNQTYPSPYDLKNPDITYNQIYEKKRYQYKRKTPLFDINHKELEEDEDDFEEEYENFSDDHLLPTTALLLNGYNLLKPKDRISYSLEYDYNSLYNRLEGKKLLSLFRVPNYSTLFTTELQGLLLYYDNKGTISKYIIGSRLSPNYWLKDTFKRKKLQKAFIDYILIPWLIENKAFFQNNSLIPLNIGFSHSKLFNSTPKNLGLFDNMTTDFMDKVLARMSRVEELKNITKEDLKKIIGKATKTYEKNSLEQIIQNNNISVEEQEELLTILNWIEANKRFPTEEDLKNNIKTKIYGYSKNIDRLQQVLIILNKFSITMLSTARFNENYWFKIESDRETLQNLVVSLSVELLQEHKTLFDIVWSTDISSQLYSTEKSKGIFDNPYDFMEKLLQKYQNSLNALGYKAILDKLSSSNISDSDIELIKLMLEKYYIKKILNNSLATYKRSTDGYSRYYKDDLIEFVQQVYISKNIEKKYKDMILSLVLTKVSYQCDLHYTDPLIYKEFKRIYFDILGSWLEKHNRFFSVDDFNSDDALGSWELVRYLDLHQIRKRNYFNNVITYKYPLFTDPLIYFTLNLLKAGTYSLFHKNPEATKWFQHVYYTEFLVPWMKNHKRFPIINSDTLGIYDFHEYDYDTEGLLYKELVKDLFDLEDLNEFKDKVYQLYRETITSNSKDNDLIYTILIKELYKSNTDIATIDPETIKQFRVSFLYNLLEWIDFNKKLPTVNDFNATETTLPLTWDQVKYIFEVTNENEYIEKIRSLYETDFNESDTYTKILPLIQQQIEASKVTPEVPKVTPNVPKKLKKSDIINNVQDTLIPQQYTSYQTDSVNSPCTELFSTTIYYIYPDFDE